MSDKGNLQAWPRLPFTPGQYFCPNHQWFVISPLATYAYDSKINLFHLTALQRDRYVPQAIQPQRGSGQTGKLNAMLCLQCRSVPMRKAKLS